MSNARHLRLVVSAQARDVLAHGAVPEVVAAASVARALQPDGAVPAHPCAALAGVVIRDPLRRR